MKILFVHNSVAEYRLEFWRLLGKKVELQLLVTDKNLEKRHMDSRKIYLGLILPICQKTIIRSGSIML